MSQNLPTGKKPKRRDSILKTRPSNIGLDDNADLPKIQMKRRVSFHNVKTVQNFAVNDQSLLDGPPVKQKINETMGSDGVLTPGRSHSKMGIENQSGAYQVCHSTTTHTVMDMSLADTTIHKETTEVNNTMAIFMAPPSSDADSTMAMFSRSSRNLEFPNEISNEHRPVKFDLDSTRIDIVDMSMDISSVTTGGPCDNTMAMFGKNNTTICDKENKVMNSTLNENTALIFKAMQPERAEDRNSEPVSTADLTAMEEDTMHIFSKKQDKKIDNTMAMFGSDAGSENTMAMFDSNNQNENTMKMFAAKSFIGQNGDCDMDITLQGRNDTSLIKSNELASLPAASPASDHNDSPNDANDMDISDMNCVISATAKSDLEHTEEVNAENDTFAVFNMNNSTFAEKKGEAMEKPRFSRGNLTLVMPSEDQTLTVEREEVGKDCPLNFSTIMEARTHLDNSCSMDISSARKNRLSFNNTTFQEQCDVPRDVSIIQVATLADISQNSSMASISEKLTSYFQNLRYHPHTLKVTYLEPLVGEHTSVSTFRNSFIEKLNKLLEAERKKNSEELEEALNTLKTLNPAYVDAVKNLNGKKLNAVERDAFKAGISLAEAEWFRGRKMLAESLHKSVQEKNAQLVPLIEQKKEEIAFCDSLRDIELENNELEQKLNEFVGLDVNRIATIRDEYSHSIKEVRRLKDELHKVQMETYMEQQEKMRKTNELVKETSKFVMDKINAKQEAKKRIAEKVQLLKEELCI